MQVGDGEATFLLSLDLTRKRDLMLMSMGMSWMSVRSRIWDGYATPTWPESNMVLQVEIILSISMQE